MNILQKNVINKCFGALAVLACVAGLSACGGGGGNPGTVPGAATGGSTVVSKAAKVELVASSATILSSGDVSVTLKATAKDAGNNGLAGETLAFTTSAKGTVSNVTLKTDASGNVAATLTRSSDAKAGDVINITVADGAVVSTPLAITVVDPASSSSIASILLTSSAGSLQSGSSAGVNLVALVKDVNNTVVKSALITFSADSGALLQSQVSTDDKGLATVALTTGNDPTLRTITVTADAGGGQKTTSLISVVGTKVSLSATNSVKVGASSSMTVKLVDSNNIGLAGKAVSFTSAANAVIAVKGGGAAVTDSSGQLILTYTAPAATPSSGSDVITVKAGGDTTSSTVAINSSNFTINAVNGTAIQTSAAINVCQPIAVHDDLGGAPLAGSVVGITTSLGNIYSDNVCTLTVTPFVFNGTGDATAYVLATSPGVAALQAAAGGATVTGTIEFVAPLTASATVNVQASPAVLGVNLAGSSTQQSTLSATVLDGTAQNNRVKNAFVSFSVVSDASGGSLTSPATVLTGSDGVATVNYIAGSTNTALNGVQIKAAIQGGVSNASNVVNLTVARAVSITAGTGNTVATPDSTTYRLDYSVSVTDSTGAAVADVKLDALVRPRSYKKGALQYQLPSGPWLPVTSATCLNEDTDNTGIYSVIKDTNRNGFLDPGLPVTITPHVTTDVNGRAIISLTYTRDRANWIDVDFTIRGTVAGTESTYTGYTVLPYLASDFSNLAISPPGRFSPYGQDSVCTDSN